MKSVTGDKLTLLARYYDLAQAHIIKEIMEQNDILCFLFDGHMTGATWHLNIATGGVRLMVMQSDLSAAQEILDAVNLPADIKKPPLIERENILNVLASFVLTLISGVPTPLKTKKK